MSELFELAKRFPDGFIESKGGNSYVAHHIINQRLLTVVGPFDFELQEVFRGDVAAVPPNPRGSSQRAKAGTPALQSAIVGASYRLRCIIDGRQVTVTEAGDVGDPHNWPHDGARLKDAASDALKRCAMRLGLGLHLWAQEHYFLEAQLASQEQARSVRAGDEGPAQPQEEASPANLEETVARSRPAPSPEPGQSGSEPAPEVVPEPELELEPEPESRFGDRAAMASGTTTQETARFLRERGDTGAAERLELAAQQDLADAHKALADGGLDPEVLSLEDNGPAGERDGTETPEGWEEPSTSADSGWPQLGVEAAENGEVLSIQALADQLGVHMVRACNALKQDHQQWADHRVGWFAHLEGDDLAMANFLLRKHYEGKESSNA